MRIFLCLPLLLLAGCSSPPQSKLAVMYNPATKDTQRCTVDPGSTWEWQYADVIQHCVSGYEKAGYKRVDKS